MRKQTVAEAETLGGSAEAGDGGKARLCLLRLKHRDLPSRDLSDSADALRGRSCKLLDPFQGAGFARSGTHAAGGAGTHGQAHAARSA